ncbi:MAG: cytochrome d ubiquinol oxidase subunit II [Desulfobacca sp. RBG_16_60_12]|nr:MAG: cytochrome d ubiquinol oxidase subunit II [Desulfobacca sp. RBG_16_60_12]
MLETIWFILWGVLWSVYFMLDGYDLGLGSLLPFLAKNETDRRLIYRAMGPFWDGNEVWLITAGGVTFAAFPATYAMMFSSLYSPLMLILFALIFRGVSLAFRGEVDSPRWKAFWDGCLVVGSFLPALLLGVAFANIFRGLPIDAAGVYQGNFFTLLNPYGLAGGLLFVLLFLVHGSLWLAVKTEGALQTRAGAMAARLWPVLLVVAAMFLLGTRFQTPLFNNYGERPVLLLIPTLAVASLIYTYVLIRKTAWWKAWFSSCLTIVSVTLFGVVGLYPNLFPSRLDPAASLTAFNSASSPLTLKIMLGVALTFVPLVIAYQTWVHFLFKGKVKEEDVTYDEGY